MGFVLLAYLLLGARVTLRAAACVCGMEGGGVLGAAQASVSALGVGMQLDATLALQDGKLRLLPKYGAPRGHGRGGEDGIRWWEALREAFRAAPDARAQVRVRLGLGEAYGTAMTAGALRALLACALAEAEDRTRWEIDVRPDYARAGFTATARCIFSLALGDIMAAALCRAANKRRKEGKRCHSIPSRA